MLRRDVITWPFTSLSDVFSYSTDSMQKAYTIRIKQNIVLQLRSD